MSDVAVVLSVGLMSGAGVAVVWLRHLAESAERAEARDERDSSAVAILRARMEALEATMSKLKLEQQTFMANARGGR